MSKKVKVHVGSLEVYGKAVPRGTATAAR